MQDFGTKANDTAGPSGQLSAEEFNNLATELENSVLRSGQALSSLSTVQMATSMFLHGVKSQTFQDSGVANAYVATPVSGAGGVLLPSDYTTLNGSIFVFEAASTNSGNSTLNIGQTTGTLLGAKKVLTESGAEIAANSIVAGQHLQVRYDASLDTGAGAWVLLRWSASPFANHGIAVFSSAGVSSWTVPDGVTQAFTRVIAGGGGGGSNANAGGGGGGGGISEELVNLVGVTSVSVTVGAGGAGATAGGGVPAVSGGSSSFGAFCSATGGAGATGATGQDRGLGGIGSGGDINDTLGPGYQRHDSGTGGQVSGKGGGPGGGASLEGGVTPGVNATGYGCGGGGGTGGAAGGAGKDGIVIIRW